ncbi:MAG: hypothetical protein WD176_06305 [Pirellulales bacterium]
MGTPRVALALVLLLGVLLSGACAQAAGPESSRAWLSDVSTEKLSALLIFGAGLVAAAGWAIGHIIQVVRTDRIEHEDITGLLNQLESIDRRLTAIEQAVGVQTSELQPTAWSKKDSAH